MADKQLSYEIKVGVDGEESVADLSTRLDSLANVLDGEVKTRAQAAAAALRELGQQDQAINQFNRLKTEVNASGNALKAAEREAANFAQQIAAAGPPTVQEAAALQKLQAAAANSRTALEQQQQALAASTADLQKFGVSAKNAGENQQRLRDQIKQVRESVQDIAPAYQGAASSAEQSSTRQVSAHRKVSEGVQSISSQLDGLKGQMLSLVGVGIGAQGIKDLAAMADGYKNLEARIKLVTGEGKAFDTAFAGVFEVAKRTNSAVEETGQLFTKLAEAGKLLGLSQQDALSLTETINQSIQLSGASAEASKASITQLIQGLQGGALRGDEFNSVMEQSPRLAKALADGLGVTTGELRKLAEEGKLTSATVISSLQKQSDTIASEFDKLPATVGRAMTNLSTEFTRYVGEADKAGGYTTKLAAVIDVLAGNLSTVATVMIHTGQALGAMKLLTMAQEWLSAGAAIKTTVVATEAAAASMIRSTAATVANTTATTANTVAQRAHAASLTGTGAAAAGSQTQITAFGSALKLLKGFAVLDIALNFKSYGTAIGEAAAKLMGYKDGTEALARADKLAEEAAQASIKARREEAAALKEAADRSFDLGKAGAELVSKFDEMRTKGDSASEAIGKIGKDFDLANVPGIKNAVSVLDKLVADGKISATEFQKAWADALKGEDLAAFETKAMAAFKGTSREAERLGQVMDASLRESIRRAGLDFELISGGMGKASASAINDTEAMIKGLDRLKAMGVDAAQSLTASIGKSINTAESQKALDVVKTQIEAVRKALGDKVADGLLDQAKQKADQLMAALDKAKPGIDSLKEAMLLLGIVSDETLKKTAASSKDAYDYMVAKGTSSARELSEGFKKSADDAIAANKGIAPSWVTAVAAARGYEVQVDSAGKATVRMAGEGSKAVGALGEQFRMTTEQVKANEDAMDQLMMKYTLSADYTERQIGLIEKENALVERRNALERERLNIDKEGYSLNTAGQRVNVAVESQASIYQRAKDSGLTEAQALELSKKTALPYNGPGLKVANSLDDGANWSTKLQKQIDQLVLSNAAGSTSTAQTKTYRVVWEGNGKTEEFNLTSDADAQRLVAALQNARLSAS